MGNRQPDIEGFIKGMKIRFNKCLDPTLSCPNPPINAHSVQNATSLGLIARNNHVYQLSMKLKNGDPICSFEKIGRNQASIFPGLCNTHDTEIFRPIDTKPLVLDNNEQLFLIAYRSVTRELHTVMEGAMRIQMALERQIATGVVPNNEPLPPMMEATSHWLKAWSVWKYRLKYYDEPLVKRRFGEVFHSVFLIDNRKPVLAASSFFSVDNKQWGRPFSAVALNVIPMTPSQSAVVVSYPREQSGLARRYVAPIFMKHGEEQLFALSCMLVNKAENFFIAPSHLEGWPEAKRKLIENVFVKTAFVNTITHGQSEKPPADLMLF